MFSSKAELFHMDNLDIQYTGMVSVQMMDSMLNIMYCGFPYLLMSFGGVIMAYGVYAIAKFMDIPRAFTWAWYLLTFCQRMDIISVVVSIISVILISYMAYSMISDIDSCLERAKTEQLELLARIADLENENATMKGIFKKMVSFTQDDLKILL